MEALIIKFDKKVLYPLLKILALIIPNLKALVLIAISQSAQECIKKLYIKKKKNEKQEN
jgi:hypothetical protein